ncbi:MAG: Methyltransferase type 11, partial [Myxococcaceae bacterium]|nr:Methyltransferase type 11 [Myxococcaceae bacterium]
MRGNDAEAPGGHGSDDEFLAYWERELLAPGDPQRARWAALERAQIGRNEGIAAELGRFVSLRGRRVLDVGCQTGALPIALCRRGADVTGVDVEEKLVEGARIRARGHGVAPALRVAVAEALPFADASFDVVTFVDVIEHVRDARAAVRELARVLRPGGTLYLFGPNRLSPALAWSDPHYQLAGVSVLPRRLGELYVTKVRGFPRYDVGVLPVGGVVERWLAADGLKVVDSA